MGRPQQQTKADSPLPSSPPTSPPTSASASASGASSSQFQFMDTLKKLSSRHSISMFQLQKIPPYKRLIGRDDDAVVASRKERLRDVRHSVAKSKSGLWGPTHSFDSDDDNDNDNDNDSIDERNDKNVGGIKGNKNRNRNGHGSGNGNDLMKKTLGERSTTGEGTNTTHEDSYSSSYGYDFSEKYRCSPATQTSRSTSNKRLFGTSSAGQEQSRRINSSSNAKENQYNSNTRFNADADADADANSPLSPFECAPSGENQSLLKGLWYSATAAVNELISGDCAANGACSTCQGNERTKYNPLGHHPPNTSGKSNGNGNTSPKLGRNDQDKKIYSSSKRWSSSSNAKEMAKSGKSSGKNNKAAILGIERLSPPSHEISFEKQRSNASSLTDGNKHNYYNNNNNKKINGKNYHRQQRDRKQGDGEECGDDDARAAAKLMAEVAKTSPTPPGAPLVEGTGAKKSNSPEAPSKNHSKNQNPPFPIISIDSSVPFQKSISELTMRSVYGESITPVSDMRRMAYYAVGKNHGQRGSGNGSSGTMNGGNRKCYFTGEPVINGRPFYAGCVQQGMRTLIVFCLPSALGLPKREDLEKVTEMELTSSQHMGAGQKSTDELSRRTLTGLSTAALSQHDSIYNDEGFVMSELFHSTAWTEDENGNLCESLNPDFLLQALPDPSRDLLLTMQKIFPEQYASLSPQLRRPHCWRLYVKFCFFSGLPIADGEMYYKVLDEVVAANSKKNKRIDEISLSHEVMEAVSGESAEILTLPGNKTFQYLQKHYKQQCAKLTPQKLYKKVFDRSSWVRVMPEV